MKILPKSSRITNLKSSVSDGYLKQIDEIYENKKKMIPSLEDLLDSNLNFDLRHTRKQFSNFVLKDHSVLIQPVFDPSGE